ncbi:SRPBCC family protein [Plantibacter sp. YIM 135347]|uniref:SRPBCC family protein n=1 Tax=Plantibacter sp. YIM 135347 TaxID=3423919 RepID=UPI003D34CF31
MRTSTSAAQVSQTIEVSRHIEASAAAIWEVLTDVERSPTRLRSVDAVRVVEGPEYRVGTSWFETRTLFGCSAEELLTVTEADAPLATTIEACHDGVHGVTRFTIEPTGGDGAGDDSAPSCLLTMRHSGGPASTRLFDRLSWRLVGGYCVHTLESAMLDEVEDLAIAALARERVRPSH